MQLAWSAAQHALIEAARRFAAGALAPRAPGRAFDREAWDLCGREGIAGLIAPRAWRGREAAALLAAGIFDALGRGGADRGLLFALGAHVFGCTPAIARWGSREQHDRWGAALAAGRAVAALAVSEESGGSHVAAMQTRAAPDGDGYLLTGRKAYVTNAPVADVFLLIASEHPHRGAMGLSAFLLPRETPGVRVETLAPTLGLRGAPMARIDLQECRVPRAAMLGRPGSGFALLQHCMQWERTCLLAGFIGAAERDLETAVGFARRRGEPRGALFEHQAVAHRLARVRCRLEAARWTLYRGAAAIDHGEDPLLWPAMVKWTVSETVVDTALELMRLFAAPGWLDAEGSATALRDVVATLSASGTSDAQLNIVAACLKR